MTATLAERLGYRADDIVVIVNCDDLGSSHAANDAIASCLGEGAATSATLMVPCPWSAHAAAAHRDDDIGIHLTLTSEWETYRWGPLTDGATLRDAEGRFPRTNDEVWERADLDEVRAELDAQIRVASAWGVDLTHLDSHMGTMQLDPRFFEIYLELAVAHRLPLRLSGRSSQRVLGFDFRDRAEQAGVLAPDHLVVGMGQPVVDALGALRPGVTEFFLHPSSDLPELRALAPDWENRVADSERLAPAGVFAERLADAGAHVISYRPLRELQRGVVDPAPAATG